MPFRSVMDEAGLIQTWRAPLEHSKAKEDLVETSLGEKEVVVLASFPLSVTIVADAAELLRSGKANVFGADSGVGYPVAHALPNATIVPGIFGVVPVAVALPKGRSSAAQALLATVIDEAKKTGVVQRAIDAKDLKGVSVATS